jgi:ribose 5-phosphate isomerase B
MKISIGCDHAGFELKEKIKNNFLDNGIELMDRGTYSQESTDYPLYAHHVAEDVAGGSVDCGILICGSANGVCMTANKHAHIRAALCWNNEVVELARKHNNANIICLPARFINEEQAFEMVTTFLSTEFEGGRHEKRVNKIDC